MPRRKKVDARVDSALTSKLATARDALEENLKRLLRKHIPNAPRNYPKALVTMCPSLSITSAKRYVGQLPDDYSYPNLVVLIEMAEAFKVTLSELLEGVHDRASGAPPTAAGSSSNTGTGTGNGAGTGTHGSNVSHLPAHRHPRHVDSLFQPETELEPA